MSRTNKDCPIEYGGKYNKTHINKNIKLASKNKRKKYKNSEFPDGSYINKILANRRDWD